MSWSTASWNCNACKNVQSLLGPKHAISAGNSAGQDIKGVHVAPPDSKAGKSVSFLTGSGSNFGRDMTVAEKGVTLPGVAGVPFWQRPRLIANHDDDDEAPSAIPQFRYKTGAYICPFISICLTRKAGSSLICPHSDEPIKLILAIRGQ